VQQINREIEALQRPLIATPNKSNRKATDYRSNTIL
jgi:hypothetical protein